MPKWFLGIALTLFLSNCNVEAPPHRNDLPPAQGGTPPGHGGPPPDQVKKKPGPPALVVAGTPAYILVPGTNVLVMVGLDADVFLVSGIHYYHHEGAWYRAVNYLGPWRGIHANDLPSGLRGRSPKDLKARVEGRHKKGR